MEFENSVLSCEDCGEEFVFSGEEQQFYYERGFQTPKRCKPCRQRRKAARTGQRELHSTICAECGIETQVPFKPSGDRPVYCRDCYQKRRGF
ncbi:MAG: zinc-binding protein [Euryarchaeota archaeon]|nr:zinc-binding protein [Euryarchaeota archaeon]